MAPDVAKRLLDAHSACTTIAEFVRGVDAEGFAGNRLVQSAVERQLEIIGEALGRAVREDGSLANTVPEIPRIVGLRNRLIHGYDSVDDQVVWDIVQSRVPALREVLGAHLVASGYSITD